MASKHLTESRHLVGLQCLRRLRLGVHELLPYGDRAPGSPQDIGRNVHLLFPGGVPVSEDPWQYAKAITRVAAVIDDPRAPAIFEAAIEYDGIRVRVDAIERLVSDTCGQREVKSGAGLKDRYIDDIALQAFVLKVASVVLSTIELLHVNTTFLRGGEVAGQSVTP